MTSTTIRVSVEQREQLRRLAEDGGSSMTETLSAALEALRRHRFYADMAAAEERLRSQPAEWAAYEAERDAWLSPDLTT